MQNETCNVLHPIYPCIDTQAVCITQFKTKYNAICWKPWSLLFVLLLNTNAISNEQGGGWGVTDENRLNCLCRLCQIFFSRLFIFCCFHYILFGIGKDWISETCSHSWFRSRLRFWDLGFAAVCQSIVPLFHRQWDNCTIAQRAAANNASNSPYIPFSTSLSSSFSSSFSFFTFSFTYLSIIIIASISTHQWWCIQSTFYHPLHI